MLVRRSLHGRGRWLVVPVIATLLLIAVGGALATLSAATGRTDQSAAGQMVDVAATGSTSSARAQAARPSSSRPGSARHPPPGQASPRRSPRRPGSAPTTARVTDAARAAGPQDGIALATDLHTLLERAGVPGPYVLVAHSSGGPYVRVFAAATRTRSRAWSCWMPSPQRHSRRFPITRASTRCTGSRPRSPRHWPAWVSLVRCSGCPPTNRARAPRAARAMRSGTADALEQAKALTTLGDRPLIVVTAASDPGCRLARRPGPDDRPLRQQRSPRHRCRHPRLAHLGRGLHDIHPGDHGRPVLAAVRTGATAPMTIPPSRFGPATSSAPCPAHGAVTDALRNAVAVL